MWATYKKWHEAFFAGRPKLVYLSAPYSKAEDKDELMRQVMKFSGDYMVAYPGQHVVSPLFNHYSLHLVPQLGSDYDFWGSYSRNLLSRCDLMIVLQLPGWDQSVGVADEIAEAGARNIQVKYLPINRFA